MKMWKRIFIFTFISFWVYHSQALAQNTVENIRYLVEQTAIDEQTENIILRIVQGKDPVHFYFSPNKKSRLKLQF